MFALTQQETNASNEVVAGTIYTNSLPAYVLFDYGATISFSFRKFFKALENKPNRLDEIYRVCTPGERILHFDLVYRGCKLGIARQEFIVDLIKFVVMDSNVSFWDGLAISESCRGGLSRK